MVGHLGISAAALVGVFAAFRQIKGFEIQQLTLRATGGMERCHRNQHMTFYQTSPFVIFYSGCEDGEMLPTVGLTQTPQDSAMYAN